jgi:hypothetical protein
MDFIAPAAKSLVTGKTQRVLNTHQDVPDLRDHEYRPPLIELALTLRPDASDLTILDQKSEGACTGFGLAAVINLQDRLRHQKKNIEWPGPVSPRMLYEMARAHDEWPGEAYAGSSIRGALKGFFHNGVCTETLAPYVDSPGTDWHMNVDQSKNARNVSLGAYYRLAPRVTDYQVALNETGAILVSALVHSGWTNPPKGVINPSTRTEGGHAFAIVGYTDKGFLVQNSWGEDWGGFEDMKGVALWSYNDWAESIMDAWALRLSVPMPEAFDLIHTSRRTTLSSDAGAALPPAPIRKEILGHFLHVDDGKFADKNWFGGARKYWIDAKSIDETANHLRKNRKGDDPYRHLLFYAHGGLNTKFDSARRIKGMKEVFKKNRIYPFHFMWETGFGTELFDIITASSQANAMRAGFGKGWLDPFIENVSRGIGRRLWSEMKNDAIRAFAKNGAGFYSVKKLIDAATKGDGPPLKIHLAGQSAGSLMLGELLKALPAMGLENVTLESCSLKAPACTIDYYNETYHPQLASNGRLKSLVQYSLTDAREQADPSTGPYSKSLLYLVSHAFEADREAPILGMEKHSKSLTLPSAHKIHYAGRSGAPTNSTKHGGFDNDKKTMDDILETILQNKPTHPFTSHELGSYR